MTSPEYVTITLKEYASLQSDSDFLDALNRAGVDNWEGYDIAVEILEGSEEYD